MSPDNGSLVDENGANAKPNPATAEKTSVGGGGETGDAAPKPTRLSSIGEKPLGGDRDASKGNDCLVVIYTKEPSLLGRRFVLETSPTRIGRGVENHVVLEGDSVSRRHAHFEQRSAPWWCVDDGSTNGSYVNDEQIMREARLGNGDRIKIGPTIFKFISGQDVEAQYHEEIYRMTIIDGLTQVHVKRYLLESLDKELTRARRLVHDLGLLMIDIDHLKKINEVHGHLAGDYVLRETARLVQEGGGGGAILARYGGEEFAMVLPETNLDGVRSLSEGLCAKVEQSRFLFQGKMIRVTISIGGSIVQDGDRVGLALVERAAEKLYEAKRAGGNCVSVGPSLGHRPVLDGMALIERIRLEGFACTLVALEIHDETTIIERYGVPTFEAWFRELLRIVELGTDSRDTLLGRWRDRYVLASVRPEAVDQVLRDVHTQWDSLQLSPEHPTNIQHLRHAALSPDELSKFGDRALVRLAGSSFRDSAGWK